MHAKEYKPNSLDRAWEEGVAKGEALGEAKALLKVLRSRGVELTSEQEQRVTSCLDAEQLDRWLGNAAIATSASDVFKD